MHRRSSQHLFEVNFDYFWIWITLDFEGEPHLSILPNFEALKSSVLDLFSKNIVS